MAPSQAGIDAWAKLGNTGWDWKSLKPYYRKFYTLNLPEDELKAHLGLDWIGKGVAGDSGPIQVSFTGALDNPMPMAWNETFRKLGLETSADPFRGISMGAYSNMQTVDPKTRTRSYSANAYAAPAMSRPNLKIIYDAEARRILFDESRTTMSGEDMTATGVEYILTSSAQPQTLRARKEVILASGVYQSPKLLELSGIGDQMVLSSHNIPCIIDNPNVGAHLQDHLMTGLSFEVLPSVPTVDGLMRKDPAALSAAQEAYATSKTGPFTIGGIGSHAYLPIQDILAPSLTNSPLQTDLLAAAASRTLISHERTVLDLLRSGHDGSGALFLFQAQGVTHENEATSTSAPKLQDGSFFSIGCIQTHPLSTGSSHIASRDPSVKPVIDPRYFENELDLEVMARHLLFCLEVQKAEPLAGFFKKDGRRNHRKAFIEEGDVQAAKQYLRETAKTTYHGCGTCRMAAEEHGGVVNDRLMVHGTKNVRVVDASVFPLIPRGNIMSTVYAVAEKAADLIKEDLIVK